MLLELMVLFNVTDPSILLIPLIVVLALTPNEAVSEMLLKLIRAQGAQ